MPTQYIHVINEKGRVGTVTGLSDCTKKGCDGLRVSVRWPDGTHSRPCNKEHLEKIAGTEGDWRIKPKPEKKRSK